jgi:hypothetical protein
MKRNLGAPLFHLNPDQEQPLCPFCLDKNQRKPIDPYGDHLCSCKKGGGPVNTHNALRDLSAAALYKANIPFTKELPVPMAKTFGNPTWRADISLPAGIPKLPDKELHLDFTITNPLVKSQISKAGKQSGSATISGEKNKLADVGKHLPASCHFLPVSLSVFGAVGDASRPFFNHLLTQLAYQSKTPFHEVASSFWITQSILLQRFKAQTIHRALLALQRTRLSHPSDIRTEHPLLDIIAALS